MGHNRRSGGPVAGPRKDYHPRGPSGPYSSERAIKAASLGKSGKTTDAVAHAKLRKRNRIPTESSSVADTISFIKACSNLDPDRAGAMVAIAGGTREDVLMIVAWAKAHYYSGGVTKSHLQAPPPPKQTLQQMAYAAAMATDPPKLGSALEFPAPPKSNLPGGRTDTVSTDDLPWHRKCEDYIAQHGARGRKLPEESWKDYYEYLTA